MTGRTVQFEPHLLRPMRSLMRNFSALLTTSETIDGNVQGVRGPSLQINKRSSATRDVERRFSDQQGILHFLVCTNKDCGTRWERLVRQDAFGARHVWKVATHKPQLGHLCDAKPS